MCGVSLLGVCVRRAAAAAASVLALGTGVLGATFGAPVAAAQPCPDVELIFARGTSEPPGIGRVGQALADALRPQLGERTLGIYPVNYPATYDFLASTDGAVDAANRIQFMAQQCPDTKIVLGGYSQGAAVVDMLAGVPPLGNRVGHVGAPLASDFAPQVAALAVFGNPSAKFGIPLQNSPVFGGRGIDLCSQGDPICSDGRNPFAHTNYETSPLIGAAADFIIGRL
ncbi:cutinase family protein [uncultured Mycolicibacterium sp.]|uniref:cutinase family protein n=1 Tax=uncultured Mycolicibacterium sp. TaxID=2320817 RepID=UPI00260D4BE9|nr:cutinase family protein [uncultured Mycolicibacterium sp.]